MGWSWSTGMWPRCSFCRSWCAHYACKFSGRQLCDWADPLPRVALLKAFILLTADKLRESCLPMIIQIGAVDKGNAWTVIVETNTCHSWMCGVDTLTASRYTRSAVSCWASQHYYPCLAWFSTGDTSYRLRKHRMSFGRCSLNLIKAGDSVWCTCHQLTVVVLLSYLEACVRMFSVEIGWLTGKANVARSFWLLFRQGI